MVERLRDDLTAREDFNINLNCKEFRNSSNKWSDRIKEVRNTCGGPFDEAIEKEIKTKVAECVSKCNTYQEFLIEKKSGFIYSLVESLEMMIEEKYKN